MRGLYWMVTVLLGIGSVASGQDPFEVNPAHEHLVVNAKWGDQPGEFAKRSDDWGISEVGSFGPFCVDNEGRVYIADIAIERNDVKVFAPDGHWLQSVPMIQQPNLVSDLAVYGGRVYWFGETMPFAVDASGSAAHRFRVFSVGLDAKSSGQLSEIAVSPALNLSRDERGRECSGNCSFQMTPDGLLLFALRTHTSYPLLRGGDVVSVEEQLQQQSQGLKANSTSIAFDFEHGDIVRFGADGKIEKVLVRNASMPRGAAGSYFLAEHCEIVHGNDRFYFDLYDTNGNLLSCTRMPMRDSRREIEIMNQRLALRLAADGSWYEMYVDELGVHVGHFTR